MPADRQPPVPDGPVQARFLSLLTTLVMVGLLLLQGDSPTTAVLVAVAATSGAVEVACRLTDRAPRYKVRVAVVIVVLVFTLSLLSAGVDHWVALMVALAAASAATEISRKLTGTPYRLPRLTF